MADNIAAQEQGNLCYTVSLDPDCSNISTKWKAVKARLAELNFTIIHEGAYSKNMSVESPSSHQTLSQGSFPSDISEDVTVTACGSGRN